MVLKLKSGSVVGKLCELRSLSSSISSFVKIEIIIPVSKGHYKDFNE